jgi:sec-independent protein translocase protein TatA
MFGSIGMPELIIILTLALIIFGPRKLPELGRSLGKSLGEFKRASNELRNTLDEEIRLEEERSTAQKAAEPATPPPPATASAPGDRSEGDHDHSVPRDSGTA